MKRKYPTLDILSIMKYWSTPVWNAFLTKTYEENDLEKLKKTLYGLQCGMDELTKKGKATDEIINLFIRLTRSIEITAKKVINKLNPSRFDDPMFKPKTIESKNNVLKELENKRKRDVEFTNFLRDARF